MIRLAKKEDAKEVAILLYDAIGKIAVKLTGGTTDNEVLATLEEYFKQEVNRLSYNNTFVKVLDDKVVGIAILYHGKDADVIDAPILTHLRQLQNDPTLTIDKEADVNDYYLDTLSVSPDYQGHGIGSQLITAAENYAIEKKYTRLSLNVEYENEGAYRLYSRLGFQVEKVILIIGKKFRYMVKHL